MAELKKETHLDSENRNLATNLSQQTHQCVKCKTSLSVRASVLFWGLQWSHKNIKL